MTTAVAAASAGATAPATSIASAADLTWRLVNLPDSSDVGSIADVVALSDTVVATAAGGATGEHGIAWSSADDGATWASEPLPGTTHAIGHSVAWGDRVLTLGEGDGDCAHPAVTGIWIRDAAGAWAATPFDPILCAGGIAQAATAGDNAVILGTGAGDVAFAWSSVDGLKWTDRSAPFEGRLPQGVARDASGFVAFGVGPSGPPWSARQTSLREASSGWGSTIASSAPGASGCSPVTARGDVDGR